MWIFEQWPPSAYLDSAIIYENNQEEHDTANEIESTTDDNNSTLQLEIIKNKLNQETIIGNDEQTDWLGHR